jgi:hypothetical protein
MSRAIFYPETHMGLNEVYGGAKTLTADDVTWEPRSLYLGK